jgi:hypothetical protein
VKVRNAKTERFFSIVGVLVLVFAISPAIAEKDHLPRMAGAVLLAGYPPSSLFLTTGDQTLQIEGNGWGNGNIVPSMSADGRLVVSGRYVGTDSPGFAALPRQWGTQPDIILSVWSREDRRWTDHPDYVFGNRGIQLAASPDGTTVALPRKGQLLQVLDLKAGKAVVQREYSIGGAHFCWSPDGRRLAFDRAHMKIVEGVTVSLNSVFILNLESGAVTKIDDGVMPSWSPSGEWIAFYGYSSVRVNAKSGSYSNAADRVTLIHPDGTGERVITKRDASWLPVWSPDSRKVLIQWLRDEAGHMDADMVEISTGRVTKQFRNVMPIYAWSPAQ